MKKVVGLLLLIIGFALINIYSDEKVSNELEGPTAVKEKKIDWMEEVSVTNYKEGISRYVFKNGMRVVLKEDHTIPSVYILGIFKTGSLYEGEKINSGLSHILEHMAFKGTSQKNAEAIQKEIQEIGGSNNAFTSYNQTGYTLNAKSQFVEKALTILKEQLMDSILDEKELEKEKDVVIKELERRLEDPWLYLVEEIYLPLICPHSHCRYNVGGDIFANKKVTKEDVVNYYKRYYNPNRFILAVTGDFKEEEVVKILKKLFMNWEPRFVPEPYIPEENVPTTNREIIVEFENLKDNAKFILSFAKHKFPQLKESIAFDILSEIFSGGKSSRLHTKLVEEDKIFSDISLRCDTDRSTINCTAYGTVIKPENLLSAKDKLIEVVYDFAKNPPTQEEFEKVIKSYALSQAMSLESPRSVLRGIVRGELSENNPTLFLRRFDDIKKVKLDDVINAYKEFFTDDLKYVFAAIVPIGYRSKFEEIKKAQSVSKEDIQTAKLNNGIEIVVRNNPTFGYGSINLVFKDSGYYNQDKQKAGIISLTFDIMQRGTKTKDRKTIDNEFEKLGTSFNSDSFTSEGHYGFGFEILKDDLDKALELTSDIILNPSFPEDEFTKIKELLISSIKQDDEEPFSLIRKAFSKRFYQDHVYGFYPTIKTVNSITLEDVKKIYQTYIKPDKLLIVISGPWTIDEIKSKIEKFFGNWQGQSPQISIQKPLQPRSGYVFMKKKGLKTTTVLIAYEGPSYTDKDRFAGIIFRYILEPPSVGGRLFNRIRDKEALAYIVGGTYTPSLYSGVIEGYAQIDGKNVHKVFKLFKDEFNKFKKGEVTDKEISDAVTGLENSIYQSLATNRSYADLLTNYKLLNRPFDYYKQILEEARKVTRENVIEFANKYLDNAKALMLTLYPSEKKQEQDNAKLAMTSLIQELNQHFRDPAKFQKIIQQDKSIIQDLMIFQGKQLSEKDIPMIKALLEKVKAAEKKLEQSSK